MNLLGGLQCPLKNACSEAKVAMLRTDSGKSAVREISLPVHVRVANSMGDQELYLTPHPQNKVIEWLTFNGMFLICPRW